MNKDKGTVAVAVSPALEACKLYCSAIIFLPCLRRSARAGLMYTTRHVPPLVVHLYSTLTY